MLRATGIAFALVLAAGTAQAGAPSPATGAPPSVAVVRAPAPRGAATAEGHDTHESGVRPVAAAHEAAPVSHAAPSEVHLAARPAPAVASASHASAAGHELHVGAAKVAETPAPAPSRLQRTIAVLRDPSFAVSVANFAAKAALAFAHQGMPGASAAAAGLGATFAGLALARNPREWGSLPWTTASLGFTGAAAAASLVDPSVSSYLFDAAVATSLPGIVSAGRQAAAPGAKPAAATH